MPPARQAQELPLLVHWPLPSRDGRGQSPAHEKQREKRRLSATVTFGDAGKHWLKRARMAAAHFIVTIRFRGEVIPALP